MKESVNLFSTNSAKNYFWKKGFYYHISFLRSHVHIQFVQSFLKLGIPEPNDTLCVPKKTLHFFLGGKDKE